MRLLAVLLLLHAVRLDPTSAQSHLASVWLTTSNRVKLLEKQPDVQFSPDTNTTDLVIDVNGDQRFQTMAGFGASMTESSAWLMSTSLTAAQRQALMTAMFDPVQGIGINLLRQPIAATDFSLSHYSYDDMPAGQSDPALQQFSIVRDRAYVIPAVQEARRLNPALRFIASPWSAPGWMKTLGSLIRGELRADSYAPYARYLVKFLQAYAAEGIPVDIITVQNEPHFTGEDYPGMFMTSNDQTVFIRDYFAPALAQAGLQTQILVWDHNWIEPDYPLAVLSDPQVRARVSGSAFHCYAGDPSAMTPVHDAYPDKDVYLTECSLFASTTPTFADALMWTAQKLIIGSTRNWARAIVTWNVALDEQHGPHLGGCVDCTALATITRATGAITFNGEYYAIAHASKFVKPGASRIASTTFPSDGLTDVAFRNPDGSYVVVVVNAWSDRVIKVRSGAESFRYMLPAGTVATFVWTAFSSTVPPRLTVPGQIEAEQFDDGPEGVAYHDLTSYNSGGQYRNTGVDIEATTDVGGGFNVGWMNAGEWLAYSVNVATAGTYTMEARVASNGPGGTFHVEVNGVDKTGPLIIPATGGWQSWVTLTRAGISLDAGVQRLRVVVDANGANGDAGNLNYLRFSAATNTGSTPFGGSPAAIPGTIEAENFDLGSEGVAYHDQTSGNSGAQYRSTDVDVQATTDVGGGFNVGWIAAGEWLNYTVNVAATGSYRLDVRVAANGAGGILHVEANGADVTGPIGIPNTGAWQAWQTVTKAAVTLAAGVQRLRVVIDAAGPTGVVGNINYLRLTAAAGSTPFNGTPAAVPGTIEAEQFDNGGEGVAYHDQSPGNDGGAYRATGVDIQATTDQGGGFNVGWIAAGEWLKYTLNAAVAGTYTLGARVACDGPGGTFHIEIDGAAATGPLVIPNTGGWQVWQTITASVNVPVGTHVMRVVVDAAGSTGRVGNLNYLRVTSP